MDFDTEPPKEQIEAEKRKKREGGGEEAGELHTSQINLKNPSLWLLTIPRIE